MMLAVEFHTFNQNKKGPTNTQLTLDAKKIQRQVRFHKHSAGPQFGAKTEGFFLLFFFSFF